MVTHRFSLDQVEEAFATAAAKSGGAIKVVVSP
jgi:threonine dehydrogenase-like Zn-dependent dehydrogenase